MSTGQTPARGPAWNPAWNPTWTADDVRRGTERFAAALADADPTAAVPACPGWTVRDLVSHIGNVYTWSASVVDARAQAPRAHDEAPAVGLVDWYAGRADRLVASLAAAGGEESCWNFAGVDETTGFWVRRQVHETAMHLIDLDQAHQRPTSVDPAAATDGITETLEVFLPRLHAAGQPADLVAPLSLVATDTTTTWTLTPEPDAPPAVHVDSGTGVAEDRLVGTAESLWLLLWKRADDGVAREGDPDRLARFLDSKLSS